MLDDINKSQKIKLMILFLVIELITFGSGIYSGKELFARSNNLQNQNIPDLYNNYSEKTVKTPAQVETAPPVAPAKPQPAATKTSGDNCSKIKGNISGKSKIYHMPGGSFYDRTNAEICFSSESEAKKAGFVKSSR